ncbi:bifunctional DNA gyrase-topoisomerase IV [Babesia duncani]|uniref:DNA topoisomerase (ATP-hydrolyzing) n=1 Tax=Babesia duncani TaxID=323732 RepID=A0AAD9UMZ3_9APIC|nr:bifunctional DNA gyrase-topoisomerase IV [Babesia duncani]
MGWCIPKINFKTHPLVFCSVIAISLLLSQESVGFSLQNGHWTYWNKFSYLHGLDYKPQSPCRSSKTLHSSNENGDTLLDTSNGPGGIQSTANYEQHGVGTVKSLELCEELGTSFMKYALSIILGRALPDARDGLKVVHRRIIWAMQDLKLGANVPFRKCAKVVGDVLGKYHPHSDKSVYDALCRLSQQFVMRVPLVDGHGNFGSADDPPAAMRYTECRLTHFSEQLMLSDIDCQTVDMLPNFDSTEVEPSVLPTRVPSLLINGSSGIAVALSTSIPPHNPDEVISAAILMARNHGNVTNAQLLEIVKGPDFPTGGILNTPPEALENIYSTGKGSICIEAKFQFEERLRQRNANNESVDVVNEYPTASHLSFTPGSKVSIVVTEIPYTVKLSDVIRAITKGVVSGTFNGIADLRDESDRSGMRLVIELKRQITTHIEVEEIVRQLKRHTGLRSFFKCNFIALDNHGKKPIRFDLVQAFRIWLDFRVETVKKRIKHLCTKSKNRLVIVKGFIIACEYIDDIIKMIKACTSMQEIRKNLADKRYGGLNAEQINAVMKMTLAQLSKLERDNYTAERDKLSKEIAEYLDILSSDDRIYKVIEAELQQIQHDHKRLYGSKQRLTSLVTSRKSKAILPNLNTLETPPQIIFGERENNISSNEPSLVVINNSGWMQRIKLDKAFYSSSKSRSIYSSRIYEPQSALHSINQMADEIEEKNVDLHYAIAYPENHALVVNSEGICLSFNINKLRLCKRGYSIWKSLALEPRGDISLFYNTNLQGHNLNEGFLIIGFSGGELSIFRAEMLQKRQKDGICKVRLWKPPRDNPSFAIIANKQDDIFLFTKLGNTLRLRLQDICSNMDNRSRKRIKAIHLRDDDSLTNATVLENASTLNPNRFVFLLSEQGKGKLMSCEELRIQRHGGRGYNIQRRENDESDDHLIAGVSVSAHNQIIIVSKSGQLTRKNPMSLKPGSRHHKFKNFWPRATDTDDLAVFATTI